MEIMLILIAALVVVGILVTYLLWKRRKEAKSMTTNYRAFFIMGLSFTPLGIAWIAISLATDIPLAIGIPFLVMGLAYLSIGLVNRSKWNDERS